MAESQEIRNERLELAAKASREQCCQRQPLMQGSDECGGRLAGGSSGNRPHTTLPVMDQLMSSREAQPLYHSLSFYTVHSILSSP